MLYQQMQTEGWRCASYDYSEQSFYAQMSKSVKRKKQTSQLSLLLKITWITVDLLCFQSCANLVLLLFIPQGHDAASWMRHR